MKISKKGSIQYFKMVLVTSIVVFLINAIFVKNSIFGNWDSTNNFLNLYIYISFFTNLMFYISNYYMDKKGKLDNYYKLTYVVYNVIILMITNEFIYSSKITLNINPGYIAFLSLIVLTTFTLKYHKKFEYIPNQYQKLYKVTAIFGFVISILILVFAQKGVPNYFKWNLNLEHAVQFVVIKFWIFAISFICTFFTLLLKTKEKVDKKNWFWYYYTIISILITQIIYSLLYGFNIYLILNFILILIVVLSNIWINYKIKLKNF